MRRLWAGLLLLGTAACTSPCAELAQRTCARSGEHDPLCLHLQHVAQQPAVADEQACKAGVVYLDELERR